MTADTERRAFPRLPLNMLVQFKMQDMETFMREYAVDISTGGMFIRTQEPHPIGSMIYLQFNLADGEKLIEGLGEVVHVNASPHPVPGMGIEFVNLDKGSRRLIDRIIRGRQAELQP